MQVNEGAELARTLAHTLRSIWDAPDDMFPYRHFCDVELARELNHVFSKYGVGVGAFGGQAIEALGHQLKVATPHTGWNPGTFLNKLFSLIELRFATEHDVLGIRATTDSCDAIYVGNCVVEEEGPPCQYRPHPRKRKVEAL